MPLLHVRWVVLCVLGLVVGAVPADAQDERKNPGRAPLVVEEGGGNTGGDAAAVCARERREREKRRAQGLPVAPLDPNGPCRTQGTAGNADPPARKADPPPLRVEFKDPTEERRRRRIQQNQGNSTQPPLR